MARKTKEEAAATRESILDAALACFHEHGVAGSSLAAIGERAGVSRGAVYWHFKDKVDVFSSMLARICMPFDEICDGQYGNLSPLARVRRSIVAVFESMEGDERRRKIFDTALFKMEYVGELESLRARHLENSEQSQAQFARDLEAAARAQSIGLVMSPREAALGLHSLFVGLIHAWVLDGGSFSLVTIGRMSVDAYLSGLGFKLIPEAGS